MIKELWKKSLKNSLLYSIVCIFAGMMFIMYCRGEITCLVSGYTDFSDLQVSEIRWGVYVTIDLDENYGLFATKSVEDSKTGEETITDYYYIIKVGNEESGYKYMAIDVNSSDYTRMDRMAEQTANGTAESTFTLKGEICTLSSESSVLEGKFSSAVKKLGYTDDEVDSVMLDYYIDASKGEISWFDSYMLFVALGAALVIYGIVILIKGISGACLSDVRKTVSASGLSPDVIEEDFRNADTVGNNDYLKVGRLFTYYFVNNITPRMILNSNISWIYEDITEHSHKGVKSKQCYMVINSETDDKKKKKVKISFRKEESVYEAIHFYAIRFPWIVTMYSREYSDMYKNDRPQFLDIKYNKYPRN
ncbi:MAG: hypothetical protein LUC38_02620 [Oscillospiraceae bacterium]|nr:hypothetical protein [Oscillospiraceae bacterium]